MPTANSTGASTLTPAQQDRRDRIVDAGLALLAERDYERIQVRDVAEEANVALGTLYHYFSSKEHLFAEVLVRWAGTLRTNISRHPLRGSNDALNAGDLASAQDLMNKAEIQIDKLDNSLR